MSVDILCIGHAAYDHFLYCESYPQENQKYEIRDMLSGPGGPAANAALLLGRWGVRCGFAGVVGDDTYGRQILADMAACSIDTLLAEARSGHVTPVSTILVNQANASRTIINRKAATQTLELPATAVRNLGPQLILADGHELPAAMAALDACPQARSILDAGSVREGTIELAAKVEALVASERFAKKAAEMDALSDEPAYRRCLARLQTRFGRKVTVITLGERGLIGDWGEGFQHLPTPRVEAVDTTAAGDIFHGAAAYGMLQQWPWPKILTFSARAAALSVTRRGGSHSIPDLAEVLHDA